MYVIGKNDVGSSKTHELVNKLRATYLIKTSFPASTRFYLAGTPAQGVDLLHRIFSSLPLIISLILILTYILLFRAFRSVILPLKAILLDLISVAVSFAGVVAVIHYGFGSAFLGTYHLRDIEAWVLIFLFAILFGMSMDYEVFIVSRMREAWDRGSSNESAIMEGMVETGGVVTAAAAILIVAVSGLAFGHFAGLQQLGIGLAVGIFIDATVIRGLLLPSAMVLLGKWNWYKPNK
jgi:RND superfamily putative drug exporter